MLPSFDTLPLKQLFISNNEPNKEECMGYAVQYQ
jgi:hypothetical protein